MNTVTIDIETLLPWSEAKPVQTRAGDRLLRTAEPTEAFWEVWRASKQQLKDAGISVGQYKGQWQVSWWLPVDPVKAAAEREAKAAREAEAQVASRATDAAVLVPKPDGMEYLGYQKAGVAFAAKCWAAGTGVLIGDEMGLGKTIQAIGLINLHDDICRVLVVCPNTLKLNWARELNKWLTRPLKVGVQYADRPWCGGVCDVVIINFDVVHKFLPHIETTNWDLRVVDEAHYCKNPKARRTKATLGIKAKRKASLTGTPVENRPVELWPIISDLDPKSWDPKKGFFRFARRYCDAKNNGFGWDFSGHSNEAELQHKLRSTIMVRRLKADVLTELPPKRRQVIELEADDCSEVLAEEERNYRLVEEKLIELRARVEVARASEDRAEYEAAVEALRAGQGAAFEEMAKVRHATGMAKLPQAVAFINDALENGKCLVFCHHIDVVDVLKAEFPQAAVITGAVASQDRQGQVDKFQKDPDCNVFIGNNAAAEGLTLTAGAHVIFVEGDWVPGKLAQKEDRAHRIGQRDSVLVSYLVLAGSIDAQMMRANVEKLNVIDNVLDRQTDYQPETEPVVTGAPASEFKREITVERQSFERLEKEAKTLPAGVAELALQAMKQLAGSDHDYAQQINGVGFSKMDVQIGHSFAERLFLTPKQAVVAAKLAVKYRRQLGGIAEQIQELMKGAQ